MAQTSAKLAAARFSSCFKKRPRRRRPATNKFHHPPATVPARMVTIPVAAPSQTQARGAHTRNVP